MRHYDGTLLVIDPHDIGIASASQCLYGLACLVDLRVSRLQLVAAVLIALKHYPVSYFHRFLLFEKTGRSPPQQPAHLRALVAIRRARSTKLVQCPSSCRWA